MDSPEAIRKYFEYIDERDETCSPIDEGFSQLKLEAQKEAAEGIEWARVNFGLKRLPSVITAGNLSRDKYAIYRPSERTLIFRKSLKVEEAFATAVHEMTHHADCIAGWVSVSIVKQALKELGLRSNSIQAKNQMVGIVGDPDPKNYRVPEELLAYSLERYATNRANALAQKIAEIWMQRGGA